MFTLPSSLFPPIETQWKFKHNKSFPRYRDSNATSALIHSASGVEFINWRTFKFVRTQHSGNEKSKANWIPGSYLCVTLHYPWQSVTDITNRVPKCDVWSSHFTATASRTASRRLRHGQPLRGAPRLSPCFKNGTNESERWSELVPDLPIVKSRRKLEIPDFQPRFHFSTPVK